MMAKQTGIISLFIYFGFAMLIMIALILVAR